MKLEAILFVAVGVFFGHILCACLGIKPMREGIIVGIMSAVLVMVFASGLFLVKKCTKSKSENFYQKEVNPLD